MREAGCDAIQEVAFTLADGIAYVETAIAAGLDVDGFGKQLSFFFNGHNNLIEEVAKFRAARRLWESIMRERFGAKSKEACALKFHVQTAARRSRRSSRWSTRSGRRCRRSRRCSRSQSLHTNSFDEALSLPTEASATLALRTQQVIAYESGSRTSSTRSRLLRHRGADRPHRVGCARLSGEDRRLGGMVSAIEQGYAQREIQDSAYRYSCRSSAASASSSA